MPEDGLYFCEYGAAFGRQRVSQIDDYTTYASWMTGQTELPKQFGNVDPQCCIRPAVSSHASRHNAGDGGRRLSF